MAVVLVVDDSSVALNHAKMAVEDLGHTAVTASDGACALALARSDPPDLILSDIEMPEMDGFELCRAVRADPRLRHTPLILVTGTKLGLEAVLRGFDVGADEYLFKPIGPWELAARIRAMLRFREAQLDLARQEVAAAQLKLLGQLSASLADQIRATVEPLPGADPPADWSESATRLLRVCEEIRALLTDAPPD